MSLLSSLINMYDSASRSLVLAAANVEDIDLTVFINSIFKTGTITITNVTSAPKQNGTTIHFEGDAIDFQVQQDFALPKNKLKKVNFDFLHVGSTPVLIIAIDLKSDWLFNTSFLQLKHSAWDGIKLHGSKTSSLLFASAPVTDQKRSKQLEAGMSFYGHLDSSAGLFTQLSWLFPANHDVPAFGTLVLSDGEPPEIEVSVLETSLSNLFATITLPIAVSLIESKDKESGLEISTSVPWRDERLTLAAVVSSDSEGLLYLEVIGPIGLPSIKDMENFFGSYNLSENLPHDFKKKNDLIQISKVVFAIGMRTKKIEFTKLAIKALPDQKVTIIPELIKVGELEFIFHLYDPFGDRELSFLFDGILEIKNVDFIVSAKLPDLHIAASLAPYNTINLSHLIDHFGLPSGDMNPEIVELSLGANPKNKSYYFSAQLEDHAVKANNKSFALENLHFELSASKTKKDFFLQGQFRIIDLELFIKVNNSHGWEFEGVLGHSVQLPAGQLIKDISKEFGSQANLPDAIENAKLSINDLNTSFNTLTKDFTFHIDTDFSIENKKLNTNFTVDFKNYEGGFQKSFSGQVNIGDLHFNLVFSKSPQDKFFVASYENTAGGELPIAQLLNSLTAKNLVSNKSWSLSIKDALFAYHGAVQNNQGSSGFLLGLDVGTGINLAKLPLVGQLFPKDQSLKFVFTPIIASADFLEPEVAALRTLSTQGGGALPAKKEGATATSVAVKKGMNLSITLRLGSENIDLSLPVSFNDSTGKAENDPGASTIGDSTPQTADDGTKWFPIQKNFGPVSFQRLGLKYADSELHFLIDASLSIGPLSLSLEGLGVHSPISPIKPRFELSGLGLSYSSPPLEIGGAFLRRHVVPASGEAYDEYNGEAMIKAKAFSLSAIGSFAYYNHQPSLFIYAVLEYPLGGPAFFFVTGLAAGFGYNRSLLMPGINNVSSFPLVASATQGDNSGGLEAGSSEAISTKISQEVAQLSKYIPPTTGQYFLAVGIKFTSFKLVDSFALLAVSFGRRLEIDLLGLSTAVMPPREAGKTIPALAEVQLALKVVFLPNEGFLGIQAQLTKASYLLSRDCHLTGGFAFFSWFKDQKDSDAKAGDFVLSLGGYHPRFKVPAHYPKVPRLGINWKVTPQLSILGESYFALTAHALMAGGHLKATWEDGSLKAWFAAGADFLVSWKPYHYDAEISLDMGVEYTFHFFGTHHISINVGADLHVWGPPFSGEATVHLFIVSFTVDFGQNAPKHAEPIDWQHFKSSFLNAKEKGPDKGKIEGYSINLKNGLVKQVKENSGEPAYWLINPKEFALSIESSVPLTAKPTVMKNSSLKIPETGIAPMDTDQLGSTLDINIKRGGVSVNDEFNFNTPVTKNIPVALWGKNLDIQLNGSKFIEDALMGLEIVSATPVMATHTNPIDRKNFQFSVDGVNDAFKWETAHTFDSSLEKDGVDVSETILQQAVAEKRNDILNNLGFTAPDRAVFITNDLGDSFLETPQIGELQP